MSITGILPVIPTPFLDGRFDPASFDRLLEHMLDEVDGYTLLGSTGEAPSLTLDERMQIASHALHVTPTDKKVVVGVSHTCVQDACQLAVHAQENGAAGVLCSAPYYFANSPGGLVRYFAALDRALAIDLVLYDNPVSTKTTLTADAVVRLAQEVEQLRSVKLTDHDLSKIRVWQSAGLSVLAGDDPILFRFLAAGVDGAMTIAPAVFPAAFRSAWNLMQKGEICDALAVFSRDIFPFLHVFAVGDEIATTKALLADIGIFRSDELRPPLETVDDARRALLRMAFYRAASSV